MTELEKMERAKMYLDKLANGIDPITDQELPDDTVLNKCASHVASSTPPMCCEE